jgi:hypothetical protein
MVTPAVQAPPAEVLQDTPVDSEPEVPPILEEDVGTVEPPEAGAEAPAEPEAEPDIIATLPPEVLDEIVRRRGGEIPALQEQLRRERQSATDTVAAEAERTRAQHEDAARIEQLGRQATADLQGIIIEANKAIEEGDTTKKVDVTRVAKAVTDYTTGFVQAQATKWNDEQRDGFLSVQPMVATLGEPDMERLGTAMKAANKQGSRVPLVKEMYAVTFEKGLEQGYAMRMRDEAEAKTRQEAVAGQKDGLRKLKDSVPAASPTPSGGSGGSRRVDLQRKYREGTGTAAEDAEYRRILDAEQAKG